MMDLDPAAREVRRLLDGVTDDHLTAPTPCEGTPVAGLLDHLLGLSLAFTWAARKSTPDGGGMPRADADGLEPGWREVLPRRVGELAEAWRDPAAWDGTSEAGGVRMPSSELGLVALDELVLHGWDLARATGQEHRVDEESAAAVLEFTRRSALPEGAGSREGVFGPVVEVPEDAPPFHRALGYAGRDPGWAPSSP